jgi:glycosyltransferase involved in cell wall biosynthesis
MQKNLISLLMPAYNTVRFIKFAIDSIKKQTYNNWELIIVDDCSDDGTWELASMLSASDSRIKVYRNDLNLGIVKNRKRAYELSSGELVCHIDNDDMLERYALEEMLNAFDQQPDVMLIYSDIAQIGEKGEHQLYSASINFDPNKLYQHGWRHFGMYRREVMRHIDGYNEKLISGCEDGDLFMQIAEKFPCARLPKALYLYRSHGENQSGKNKKCDSCSERPVCNFLRVWSKSANYDPITFKPLEVPDGQKVNEGT